MSVIVAGQAGATWGLNAESGMIAQHGAWETEIEENPSRNPDGEFQMTSWFNPTQSITLYGISLGAGLASAVVGFAITLANNFSSNGVGTGSIFVKKVTQAPENTGFVATTINAVRRPLI